MNSRMLVLLVPIIFSMIWIPQIHAEPKGVFESEGTDLNMTNLRTGVYQNEIVIAGTIKNISDKPIHGIGYSATTFNATNEVTGILVRSGQWLPLEPGMEYSFEIPTGNRVEEVDHYTVSVSSDR